MVTFSHLHEGTPEGVWREDARLRQVPPLDSGAVRALVVLAAHPDDETLGAGGLLAQAAQTGACVHVIVATDGEASHPRSPTHSAARLAELRRREVAEAVAALAPTATVRCLGLPDGALADHGPALESELRSALRDALGELERRGAPEHGGDRPGVVLAAPWRSDAHTDHDAAGAAAARAAAEAGIMLLEYPVWMWHWGDPRSPGIPWSEARRLDLAPEVRGAKERALALHVSQIRPLSEHPGDEALLSRGMQEHFERDFELYFASGPRDARATFDSVHDAAPDPWNFTTSWYEQRKRAVTLAALPARTYRRALEVGCSIGVLTGELAARADEVVATDVSPRALERAAARLPQATNIRWERRRLPQEWPEGTFDLIVASEVGYYFTPAELDRFVERCLDSLADDGALVACHWLGPIEGWQLSGEEVHARLRAEARLETVAHHREPDFVLDVLAKAPAASVAQREGLA